MISDLENGRRRHITSAELIIIAAALNTAPVRLIYPGPYDDKIQALPNHELLEFDAAQWFSGLGYWGATELGEPGAEVTREDGREWVNNTRILRLSRELEAVQRTRRLMAKHAKSEEDQQQIFFYDSQIQWLRNELGISFDA